MRHLSILSIALLILLLAGSAAALDPVNVYITSSNQYLTADNSDSAIIMITVTDGTKKAIGNANIQLAVTEPWKIQDTAGVTPAGGQFSTTFLPTTAAGTANITATVLVPDATIPVVKTFAQNITAALPSKSTGSYPSSASVGTITDITIRVVDQYGNPVSSKKNKNVVTFTTSTLGENAFLVPVASLWYNTDTKVKVKGVSVPLNESGYADVDFVLKTRPGENYVVIAPPYPLPATLITIQGISDLKPAYITKTVTPSGNPPTVKSDNSSKFTIEYVLNDQYGNPCTNRNLSIFASSGESRVVASNHDGKVTITYGPKTQAGRYIVTARALDSPSVYSVQTLQFLSGKATNMLLTANPQTMASLDVKLDMTAWVTAKVIDANGNPVKGETVSFSLTSMNVGVYNQTTAPVLQGDKTKTSKLNDAVTAVTDGNGLATAVFTPGAFESNPGKPGFSPLAEATVKVQAKWASVSRTIDLSYKSYPYLSVYTTVDPSTVETNQTVEVSIRVRGDGYALQPRPVDVYMVTDRSTSMLWDYPDRMVLAMNAARIFAEKFDFKNDRLGQISFGANYQANARDDEDCGKEGDSSDDWDYSKTYYIEDGKTYSDYATIDLALTDKKTDVTKAVDGLVPRGRTPMRYAIYRAIEELKKNGRPDTVKAIVLLSDGDYNYYGDPLARWWQGSNNPTDYGDDLPQEYMAFAGVSSQNMAAYAKANNIRIYCIGYSASLSAGGRDTLEQLALQTGGKYFYALTGSDLTNFYTQIAGALKDTAGVNTNLAMDFSQVEVNGNLVNPGSSVLQYQRIDGRSTRVTRPDGSGFDVDNRADWTGGRLNVTLGTIKVNQEFLVNFTMAALKDGNIRIVNSGNSRVNFDDNTGFVPVPDTYITALPTGKDKGIGTPTFIISNLRRTNSEDDREIAGLQWDITYLNGNDPEIAEEIHVAPLNWETWAYKGTTNALAGDSSDMYTLGIDDLEPGTYLVKVTGYVDDAGSSFNITRLTIPLVLPKPEILIR
jgi:hypothetical protein